MAQMVKRLPTSGRPGFNPWIRKIPWRRKWQPTPVFLPGKSHGWRSLVGYSPWGCRESDMTERLHFHYTLFIVIMNIGCIPFVVQYWKVVAEPQKMLGFLASRGEEFNLGPEMRLDCSELLCNRVLLKYKRDRESFWHRHQKGAERVRPH